jgi:hypothetical protein
VLIGAADRLHRIDNMKMDLSGRSTTSAFPYLRRQGRFGPVIRIKIQKDLGVKTCYY